MNSAMLIINQLDGRLRLFLVLLLLDILNISKTWLLLEKGTNFVN